MDSLGADGCRDAIGAANADYPSLIDQHHTLANKFGVINIPSGIWINEDGVIVRPAETAPALRPGDGAPNIEVPPEMPDRLKDMMTQAQKINGDPQSYDTALRDWIEKGAQSKYALSPDEVIARSRPRDANVAKGHAHFEIASHLEAGGHHDDAIPHFRKAHELVPNSWTFRRQAWSLEGGEGPMARFWQGPAPDNPDAWPYEGDWLGDIKKSGPENYNDPWKP